MFKRIMAVVLAVILLLTAGFSVLGTLLIRRERSNARLESLITDAKEIAWLAVQSEASSVTVPYPYPYRRGWSDGAGNSVGAILNRKYREVHETYNAYIGVTDREHWVYAADDLTLAINENPEFTDALKGKDLSALLSKVLGGGPDQTVVVRSTVRGSASFAVGVPMARSGLVVGAVLIITPVQVIEGSIWEFGLPLFIIAGGTLLGAALILFFLLRRSLRPLGRLTEAANAMAEGDFSVRVQADSGEPEIHVLSSAFNSMAQKLDGIEAGRREFVANVSHELRSPITSISGFVQGMSDGTIPPEDHPRYLALVNDEMHRLSKLIGDLLVLSRLERDDATLNQTDFDLCEMFRRAVIRRMGDLERKGITVNCDFAADPCRVTADADRIEEVVVNLVDNAVKFTPAGGTISLRTSEKNGLVTAVVEDDGIAISPEDLPRIFDRFFTADRAHTSGKGTGLGLSICQRIMAMHGQRIWADPCDTGARFCFTLPAAPTAKGGAEA